MRSGLELKRRSGEDVRPTAPRRRARVLPGTYEFGRLVKLCSAFSAMVMLWWGGELEEVGYAVEGGCINRVEFREVGRRLTLLHRRDRRQSLGLCIREARIGLLVSLG